MVLQLHESEENYYSAVAGKLKEPRVITDHRQEPVCILPVGFYLDDERWERIWARYSDKGESLTHADLRALFPDEPALVKRRV